MKAVIEGSLLQEKSIANPIFFEFVVIGLIGITTIKGHEILENKLNEYKNDKNF